MVSFGDTVLEDAEFITDLVHGLVTLPTRVVILEAGIGKAVTDKKEDLSVGLIVP